MTETLELVPRQWKVIQHVREKYSCRTCETITQPPAPLQIPTQAGHLFQVDRGHPSDLKPATIPI